MSNKIDYTKYSTSAQEPAEPVFKPIEPMEVAPEVAEVAKEGFVDCRKLNVRAEPSTDAEVVCVISEGTELLIDEAESTDEFYKICTAAGVEGYCMRKFITVLP